MTGDQRPLASGMVGEDTNKRPDCRWQAAPALQNVPVSWDDKGTMLATGRTGRDYRQKPRPTCGATEKPKATKEDDADGCCAPVDLGVSTRRLITILRPQEKQSLFAVVENMPVLT